MTRPKKRMTTSARTRRPAGISTRRVSTRSMVRIECCHPCNATAAGGGDVAMACSTASPELAGGGFEQPPGFVAVFAVPVGVERSLGEGGTEGFAIDIDEI